MAVVVVVVVVGVVVVGRGLAAASGSTLLSSDSLDGPLGLELISVSQRRSHLPRATPTRTARLR